MEQILCLQKQQKLRVHFVPNSEKMLKHKISKFVDQPISIQ